MNKNNYLLSFSKDVFSQKGEDGILEKIFEIIKTENKWCVEFGAWDGKFLSNSSNLTINKGWSGIFVEADKNRYKDLLKTYEGNNKIIALNAYVNFEGENTLDNLLKKTAIPQSFDLLSIDIDGNDYHVWEAFKNYTPRVVVVEFNPTIPGDIEFIQARNMSVTQGSSLLALYNLAKKKGYELIAVTTLNAIFVKKEYFKLFDIVDNSPAVMMHHECESRWFQLYDGTVVLQGRDRLLWSDIKIKQKSIQILPKVFRRHPENMGPVRAFLFKVWRKIYNKI